jgi:crossover junction endodeoxyribonuclease RuvC
LKIVGIDPGSLITGIGIVEFKNNIPELVEYDYLKMSSKELFIDRIYKVYNFCLKKIKLHKPDFLAVETAFYGKNVQSLLKLAHIRSSVILSGLNMKIPVFEYSPKEIKKSITGSGSSSKNQVQYFINNLLKIKEKPKFYDCSDALATAVCHFYFITNDVFYKTTKAKKWSDFLILNKDRVFKY